MKTRSCPAVWFAAASCIVSCLASAARGQCLPDWTLAATTGPSTRHYHGMVYDSANSRTVLYGGVSGSSTLRQDVWAWNGSSWSLLLASGGAGPRRGMGMVYDSARNQIVVFGGATAGGLQSDTWEWDGDAWTQVNISAPAPTARGWLGMAYDAGNAKTVLFGGWRGGTTYSNETWTWDGSTWTQLTPANSPPARAFTAMTYDSARGVCVLFGGLLISGGTTYYDDTWEWNGSDWTQITPTAPPAARAYHGMAYDPDREKTVLFGGFSFAGGTYADTWDWDGSNWSQLTPTNSPTPRQSQGMAYDAANANLALFGGQAGGTSKSDTWTLSVPTAPQIIAQPQSLAVNVGDPATFSVAASGLPAPSYQWRKDGVDIAGETADSYSIASVVPGDAGVYDVVVTNACGTVTSDGATLTVNGACLPCDLNCDGSINPFDIQPFILILGGGSGCSACAGDANGDGTVNPFDINSFLACLGG